MTTIQRRLALVFLTLLFAVAPMRGKHFSDWATPINLGPVVNAATAEFFSTISKDGLSLYFTTSREGGYGGWDIYVSQRASVDELWGPPQNLGPTINTASDEGSPSLSIDGHYMFFSSTQPGGFGANDISCPGAGTRTTTLRGRLRKTSEAGSTRTPTNPARRYPRPTRRA